MDDDTKPDFFISFQKADRDWATWIAWELEALGYRVSFQPWDFPPGGHFVGGINEALRLAERMVAVLSPDYLQASWTQAEWESAFATDPTGKKGKLLPIQVRECTLDGLQAIVAHLDLVGLDEDSARTVLKDAVRNVRLKPQDRPPFPAAERPAAPNFPGSPRSWLRRPRDPIRPRDRVWRSGPPQLVGPRRRLLVLGLESVRSRLRAGG